MDVKKVAKLEPRQILLYWIRERESIRLLKESGAPKPWTDDEILQKYKFCNVRREDDAVTRWIATHWRKAHRNDSSLWFAMVVARLFNLPATLAAIGYPVPWRSRYVRRVLNQRKAQRLNIFNAAYIVSTNGQSMEKIDYVLDYVLKPLYENHLEELNPRHYDSLQTYHAALCQRQGLGSFMAGQIIADLKYTPCFKHVSDWHTFVASGPGSRRGLNWLIGRPVNLKLSEKSWQKEFKEIRTYVNLILCSENNRIGVLHAQDVQSCLCEFDKYCRTLYGEGRPRQNYPGMPLQL